MSGDACCRTAPVSFYVSEVRVFGIELYKCCVGHGVVDMVCMYSVSFETSVRECEGLLSQSTMTLSGGARHITLHPHSMSACVLDCLNAMEQETLVVVLCQ